MLTKYFTFYLALKIFENTNTNKHSIERIYNK